MDGCTTGGVRNAIAKFALVGALIAVAPMAATVRANADDTPTGPDDPKCIMVPADAICQGGPYAPRPAPAPPGAPTGPADPACISMPADPVCAGGPFAPPPPPPIAPAPPPIDPIAPAPPPIEPIAPPPIEPIAPPPIEPPHIDTPAMGGMGMGHI